jgi:hypothetical protein
MKRTDVAYDGDTTNKLMTINQDGSMSLVAIEDVKAYREYLWSIKNDGSKESTGAVPYWSEDLTQYVFDSDYNGPESIGSGTLSPSKGVIPAWKLDDNIGPDAAILSPPSKKTGPRKADKGGDIPLQKRRGPVVKLDDDGANGTGLSLKPTSRRRPGTLPTASRVVRC